MYSYDADSAAFIKRAQGLTASDCARAGAAVGAAFGRGRVGVACRNDEYSRPAPTQCARDCVFPASMRGRSARPLNPSYLF